MMFLSSLAACDLGYVGLDDLASRLTNSLDTLGRLERYRGHLLNWYETRTLEPLTPRYVSTVDSGNLAVSLLALKEGCLELADGPVLLRQQWRGLLDVLRLVDDAVARLDLGREEALALRGCLAAIETRVATAEVDPGRWWPTLRDLADRDVPDLDRRLLGAVAERTDHPATLARVRDVRTWLERLHHHVRSMDRECRSVFPWLLPLTQAPPALAAMATAVATVLPPTLRLGEVAEGCHRARALVRQSIAAQPSADEDEWRTALSAALDRGEQASVALRDSLGAIASRAETLALAMEFGLLYDKDLRLFHIGYNVTADRLDPHHYDLLASEARLASLFAIAKGDAPVEHWFHLGRATTVVARQCCLLSWGGSMFEYLMPRLLVRSEAGSLLAESEIAAVDAQRRYARTLGVPWGMSESGLSATDSDQTYQYRSFGVPALGLRRGLATETVVAPYATVLALPVDVDAAMKNLHRFVADDPRVRFQGIETDRAAFVGRGRTYRDPSGAVRSGPASSGFTLDPIMAVRIMAEVEPGATVHFAFITAVSGSRESVLELAERYQTMNAVEWVMAEAASEAGRELHRFAIEPARMAAMQTLASLLNSRRPMAR